MMADRGCHNAPMRFTLRPAEALRPALPPPGPPASPTPAVTVQRGHELVASTTSAAPPVVIRPPAELDVSTLEEFQAQLRQARNDSAHSVVVDFATVTFASAESLAVLKQEAAVLRLQGRLLTVRHPPRSLLRAALAMQDREALDLLT